MEQAQERKSSPNVHRALHGFEFVGVLLGLPLTLRQAESSLHGIVVPPNSGDEALSLRNATRIGQVSYWLFGLSVQKLAF